MMQWLAHGVGTRSDLPLPLTFVVAAGLVAVLVSFLGVSLLWRQPRLAGSPTRLLPDLSWLRPGLTVLRVLTLLLSIGVVVVGFAGQQSTPRNVAPWALYITFWVGLVPLSLAFGPVWAAINPLRTLDAVLRPLIGPPRWAQALPRLGYWPAAVSLLAFLWLELAAPHRGDPRVVASFLTGYAVLNLVAAALYGPGWFAVGDGFEVYARLIGRFAIVARQNGRLVLRNPLAGVATLPRSSSLVAVLLVLLGSTAFDGLTRTIWWQDGPALGGQAGVTLSTLGVLGCVAAVSVLYLAGTRSRAADYAPSLVPIAIGYAIAHYFSYLLIDGQTTFILASDPLGTGANLLGLTGVGVDYGAVSVRVISVVQAAAIVAGHVLAVVVAHDRALEVARGTGGVRTASAGSQVPLLLVMLIFTGLALTLLLGA